MDGMTCNQPTHYSMIYLAVLGGEVAVPCTRNPLYARLNSFAKATFLWSLPKARSVWRFRSYAIWTHESCQVLTEAALSGLSYVP